MLIPSIETLTCWMVGLYTFFGMGIPTKYKQARKVQTFFQGQPSLSLVSVESERATRPTSLARRRLKAARLAVRDDHLFDLALRKLREIILFCPEDSGAGRTMLDSAGRLVPQDKILQTLRDCLVRNMRLLTTGLPGGSSSMEWDDLWLLSNQK